MDFNLLNRDLVFEISNYLLHTEMRNLFFAFPKIEINKSIYQWKKGKYYGLIDRIRSGPIFHLDIIIGVIFNIFQYELILKVSQEEDYSVILPEGLISIIFMSKKCCMCKFSDLLYFNDLAGKINFKNKYKILDIAYKMKLIPWINEASLFNNNRKMFYSDLLDSEYLRFVIHERIRSISSMTKSNSWLLIEYLEQELNLIQDEKDRQLFAKYVRKEIRNDLTFG